ncbi:hypothetical protein BN59_00682 [Legionella massiliensis]|uniref:Uncharacterized protein n=1 Tax=Legionella massiliensis TaxID=1034943 RepID=A0A078KXJ1_9GAMM|nr:hypothetical protein [Legionella massiliensis]CDZ76413.1 hypothetical protein BN59_00682 [Legionella massiliensis]CEE12151.1 hypothetical protein BN1094_00682 [Legionella massiliensis]
MMPGKELPKVIEKSQEEIEEIINLVQSLNLPEEINPFMIGCINLASWIPKALIEHKITISNLKRLLYILYLLIKADLLLLKETDSKGW